MAGRAVAVWRSVDNKGQVESSGGSGVEEDEIRARIEIARRDHRDLDSAIEALRQMPMVDMIQLQRFKKRKLKLRDDLALLEDMLIPDIIA